MELNMKHICIIFILFYFHNILLLNGMALVDDAPAYISIYSSETQQCRPLQQSQTFQSQPLQQPLQQPSQPQFQPQFQQQAQQPSQQSSQTQQQQQQTEHKDPNHNTTLNFAHFNFEFDFDINFDPHSHPSFNWNWNQTNNYNLIRLTLPYNLKKHEYYKLLNKFSVTLFMLLCFPSCCCIPFLQIFSLYLYNLYEIFKFIFMLISFNLPRRY